MRRPGLNRRGRWHPATERERPSRPIITANREPSCDGGLMSTASTSFCCSFKKHSSPIAQTDNLAFPIKRSSTVDVRPPHSSGFTLVELAIVMTIIGLMIGGILKGQELMANARLTATIAQVESYRVAVITFRDAHAALPGDFRSAQSRLPGCDAAASCLNGNGNGIVGAAGANYHNIDPTLTSENTQFWKHIAAADLISGVQPDAGSVAWGGTHPASRLQGGFFARQAVNDAMCRADGQCCMTGLLFVLRYDITGAWDAYNYTVSPRQALAIDRKMDDGNAARGVVQAASQSHNQGCGYVNEGLNGPNGYAERSNGPRCDMLFKAY